MKKVKVRMTSMEDLILINSAMVRYNNLNFDIISGSIRLDGKSLIGLLGLGTSTYEIQITGESTTDIDNFVSEIEKYII